MFKYLLIFIVLITISSQNNDWLLRKSFEAKPIYLLRNQIKSSKSLCQSHLNMMLNNISFNISWAVTMLDANAALPAGLLSDQYTSVGDFNQCISIYHQSDDPDIDIIQGQYCFLTFTQTNQTEPNHNIDNFLQRTIKINKRFPYAYGICVPNSCSKSELDEHFQQSKEFQNSGLQNIRVQYCQIEKKNESFVEKLEYRNTLIAFPILCIALGITLLGTFWEMCNLNPNSWPMHFSMIKNTKTLFIHNENRPGTLQNKLSHIHGIRTLAMIWIIFGHNSAYFPGSIIMPFSQIARHPYDFNRLINSSIWSNLFNNAYHAVETFFFLSGFLLIAVLIDKKLAKKISFITFWGLRYLRFAIPLLGILVIHKCIMMIGNGPFHSPEYFDTTYMACNDKHWWKQLLFYNDLVEPSYSCIYFSWYLSADLQIHIIAFLLVITIRKKLYRKFYSLCLFFGLFTVIIPFAVILSGVPTFDAMEFFVDFTNSIPLKSQVFLYSAPYLHMASFFYGCAIGLAMMQKKELFFSRSQFCWYFSLITLIFTAFVSIPSVHTLAGSHMLRGLIIGIIYSSWIIALSIIIYQMSNDELPKHVYGLRKLLSISAVRPFSRLSFSMYLSQLTISHINFVLNDDLIRANQTQVTRYILSAMAQTIFLGWFLYILFECPVNNIMRSQMLGKDRIEKLHRSHIDAEMNVLNKENFIQNNNNHIQIDK